jgi:hypothetical protein
MKRLNANTLGTSTISMSHRVITITIRARRPPAQNFREFSGLYSGAQVGQCARLGGMQARELLSAGPPVSSLAVALPRSKFI